jgi:hypothetical protein
MKITKLGQAPAFPTDINPIKGAAYYGMSKRFYAACAAMQGILANGNGFYLNEGAKTSDNLKNKIIFAFAVADELLKQENE